MATLHLLCSFPLQTSPSSHILPHSTCAPLFPTCAMDPITFHLFIISFVSHPPHACPWKLSCSPGSPSLLQKCCLCSQPSALFSLLSQSSSKTSSFSPPIHFQQLSSVFHSPRSLNLPTTAPYSQIQ